MATQQEHIIAQFGAVDNTKPAFDSMRASMRNTAKQSKALNQQFRFMRGGLGQVGHQVQDIAVQLQMGTNAMIVFGQQGSQIASLFGPQGAVLGAVLAVGAAIAVGLSGNIKEADDAFKDLEERIREQIAATKDLTEAQKEFLTLAASKRLEALTKKYSDTKNEQVATRDSLALLNEELERYQSGNLTVRDALNQRTRSEKDIKKEIAEHEEKLIQLNASTEESLRLFKEQKQLHKDIADGINPVIDQESLLAETRREAALDIAEQVAKEERQAQLAMKARITRVRHNTNVLHRELDEIRAAEEQKDALAEKAKEREDMLVEHRINAVNRSIEASNIDLDAFIAAQKTKEAAKQAEISLNQQIMSSASQVLGQLMAGMDQQSGAYKALFAVQQGLAIASTIINTEMAAIAAIAPPPVGLGPVAGVPYAGVIRAIGYSSAAIIAGQTLASFEGGGFTGSGVRSGGMDGKGGRLAMVHPNEKITDLHKGQGDTQPVNVSFNIQANDARGFD